MDKTPGFSDKYGDVRQEAVVTGNRRGGRYMENCVVSCINSIELGKSAVHGRMEVVPLVSTGDPGPQYLMLDQALSQRRIVITEVSREGSVPQLKVENRGKTPVLLLDGEELAGAKQNRVLNTTILVPGESEIEIPVTCTEQGRWSYASPHFSDSMVMMNYRTRSRKMSSVSSSLRERHASRRSDQAGIWNDISEMCELSGVSSPTGAMKDLYESQKKKMDGFLAAFPVQEGQQGVIVSLDGVPAGIEFLSRPAAYARIHDKLVRSYALEALIDRKPVASPGDRERPEAFLQRIASSSSESYPAVGLGTECRLEGQDLAGSALHHEGVVVHMVCFAGAGDEAFEVNRAGFRQRRASYASRSQRRDPPDDWVL